MFLCMQITFSWNFSSKFTKAKLASHSPALSFFILLKNRTIDNHLRDNECLRNYPWKQLGALPLSTDILKIEQEAFALDSVSITWKKMKSSSLWFLGRKSVQLLFLLPSELRFRKRLLRESVSIKSVLLKHVYKIGTGKSWI